MNLTNISTGELTEKLTLTIEAADYEQTLKKKLNDRRKTAEFKGFRKGNVPASLIERIYGEQSLYEAVNDIISDALNSYIKDNNLSLMGEPIASEDQKEMVWTKGNDFEFQFDIAKRPAMDFDVTKEDVVPQYSINVTETAKAEMKKNLLTMYAEKKEGEDKPSKPAKPTQEIFDKIYGEDKVHNEEEFDAEVTKYLENNYKQESDYRLSKDIRNCVIEKAGFTLPEDFLRRWLISINRDQFTEEQIDKEFPQFIENYRWQIVREYLMDKFGHKVEEKDLREAAEGYVAYQYAMYGMADVPAEVISEAAHGMLTDENQLHRLIEQVENQKVMESLKEAVTVKAKKISVDKFRELK